jgi:hypothetical protein
MNIALQGPSPRQRRRALATFAVAMGLALVLSLLFHLQIYLPYRAGASLFLLLSIWAALHGARPRRGAFLAYVMLGAYWMTNGVLVLYILDGSNVWAEGTPRTYPLTLDIMLVAMMAQVACIGILGLAAGVQWGIWRQKARPARTGPTCFEETPLQPAAVVTLAFLSIAFYYAATPGGFIFSTSAIDILFSQEIFGAQILGSGGVNYVIYAVVFLLVIDMLRRHEEVKYRVFKQLAVGLLIAMVVIVLDFLRGNRESAGIFVALVGALFCRYLPDGVNARNRGIFVTVVCCTGAIAFGAYALGIVRYDLASEGFQFSMVTEALPRILENGTWMGGTTTNLVTMAFYKGESDFKFLWGSTYVDYLLSLPPKQIAMLFQYTRPLEWDNSPGWWFVGYNSGGLSPTVVPFYNFGAFGVAAMMFLQGWLFSYVEHRVRRQDFTGMFIYGGLCTVALTWYWYGDMPLVRATMAFALTGILYRLLRRWGLDMRRPALRRRRMPAMPGRPFHPT